MHDACILYTTDNGYLFPTLVSAIEARRRSSLHLADVLIYCIGLETETEDICRPICERENILLISLSDDQIEGQSAMLARFFLNRFVPVIYKRFLYLDGDVQIFDSLDPLLEVEIPHGRFLAANDPMSFMLSDRGRLSRHLRSYFSSIGLEGESIKSYFNTGVLRMDRGGWDGVGAEAWELFRKKKPSFRFPDQDPLNIVAQDRRLSMSLCWNFPIFMRNARVEFQVQPRITHYMSNPKPWHGVFPPWREADFIPYRDVLVRYPTLRTLCQTMTLRRRVAYHMQQRFKQACETLTWGFGERRARILCYEDACCL